MNSDMLTSLSEWIRNNPKKFFGICCAAGCLAVAKVGEAMLANAIFKANKKTIAHLMSLR